MKIRLITLVLCLSYALNISSQSFEVKGIVVDTLQEPLVSATVVALNTKDSVLTSFSITNSKGQFRLTDLEPGRYLIQATYLGYDQYEKAIVLSEDIGDLDMGLVKMTVADNRFGEVVVKGERAPIEIRKDTIVYNADAFRTQPNDKVEDLLRKMPGIEVEDDGTIKAQGETVEQILVDGKEFFGDDPKIATKNLPAKAVDKVEVYDKKSDAAEFSGIDDGERQKTMNLELKEDYKKGYFGNITGGYGTDDRYASSASINRFDKKLQLSFIGNLNNINQQGFSTGDYMSFMGGMGSFMQGGRGNNSIPLNQGLSNGNVNTGAAGINFNYEFSKKTQLTSNYFVNSISNNIIQDIQREYFLDNASYFTNEHAEQDNESINHKVNFEIRHDIDSSSDIRLRSGLTFNSGDVRSNNMSDLIGTQGETENEQDNINNSFRDNSNINGNLLYRKKFGKKQRRVITLQGSLNSLDDDSDGDLNSNTTFFPNDPDLRFTNLIVQNFLETNDQSNYSIRTGYTEPLGNGRYLDFNYRRQNFSNELQRDVYDIVSGTELFNADLSNHFKRDFVFDRYGLAFNITKDNYNLTAEMAYQASDLNGDLIINDSRIEKSFNKFLPSLNFRYQFGPAKNISFRYRTSLNEPSLTQLQPIVDNTDPLNIYVGNPDLDAEYSHSFRINLINYDQFSFRSIFAFLNATYTKNDITNQQILDEFFVQTTTPINVDNRLNLSAYVSFGTPIRALKSTIKLNLNSTYGRNILFLNNVENVAKNYVNSVEFVWDNRKKDVIDASVGTRLSYTNTQYSENSDLDQGFFNQKYFADFSYDLKQSFSFNTSFDYNVFGQESFGESQKFAIWKASISKYILPAQRGEIKIEAFDILNQNQGINLSNNLNFTEFEQVNTIGRYFLLSFTYNLNGFGNKKKNNTVFRGPRR